MLHKLFVAEGVKTISELLNSNFKLYHVYALEPIFDVSEDTLSLITPKQLQQISFLKTPNAALAIFCIPEPRTIQEGGLVLALDDIRDPGNLGTVIRLCDWFGVKDLVCNTETVDCYNPKVIQATMGSIARVNITYTELSKFLNKTKLSTFGAFMDGDNVYHSDLSKSGVVILGNEANGISSEVENMVEKRITIPRFGELQQTESLNVANAAAILLSEFRRR